MNKDLEKQYNPADYEDEICKKWDESGFFNPDNLALAEDAPAYTIVLPPPNVTDKLHCGHVVMVAIEDLLIRYKRMNGFRTLWLPGTDHAAIATQNVVEKRLFKENKKTRHDLGREKFLAEVEKTALENQKTILNQIKKMGGSLDWSRLAYTLDESRALAVKKMFIDMYNDGVIYRGERVINWCPRCLSTLADDEIEYKEQTAKLYTFKYSADFPLAISTTRPETKLGDTAVAVNPKDERYKKYVGQIFEVAFAGVKLKIKIIADRSIDMEFGTGALGVTPAHSMADYQMAQKNNLEMVKVIDENGKINSGFGEYSGLPALEAREKIVNNLRQAGLLEKEEEIQNNLSVCYRCDTAIEPIPSKQWFVKVDKKLEHLGGKSLKEVAIEAVEKNEIKFTPERYRKTYLDWMNNLNDWCVSRQIWFGHRIPAWHRLSSRDNLPVVEKAEGLFDDKEIFVGEEAPAGDGWVQDPDTLDTWFSSGMWTFSTLGWPNNFKNGVKSGDLEKFHPTSILETGHEIITLWVSRMILMSYYALGEKPFSDVYLHGMILDEKGKKMSKSKGNGIDPLTVVEQYGTDALRLSLMIGNTPGNNSRMSMEKVEAQRNFVNKLWNVARYIIGNVDFTDDNKELKIDKNNLTGAESWILNRCNNLICQTRINIDSYAFSQAGEGIIDFVWNDFADWYIEASKFEKSENKEAILLYVLKTILKLLHPFAPFITEVIWSKFNDPMLMVEKYPENSADHLDSEFFSVMETIKAIRNARAENKVEPAKKIKAIICAPDNNLKNLIERNEVLIKNLRTGLSELTVQEKDANLKNEICAVVGPIKIYLLGAVDEAKEKLRIKKEIVNLESFIKNLKKKLSNKEFAQKAPEKIVKAEKEKLSKAEIELNNLKKRI